MNADQRMAQGQLLMMKGVISDMEQHQKDEIAMHKAKLETLLADGGDMALLAFALVGLEKQLED